jgi:serine/threonine protein kinase
MKHHSSVRQYINPRFIEQDTENGNMFLLLNDGISCGQEAINTGIVIRGITFVIIKLVCFILKAYHHLHKQNVLIRDVNPENILIS